MRTVDVAAPRLERPALATELLREPAHRRFVGDRPGAAFDDKVQRREGHVPGPDDASFVGGEVAALAGSLAGEEVERAIDPEGDDRHEMWPAVRTDSGEPVVLSRRGMLEAIQGDRPGRGLGLAVDHGRL
jgi:hypothetical protein